MYVIFANCFFEHQMRL